MTTSRETTRQILTTRYGPAIPVTDEMIDAVIAGELHEQAYASADDCDTCWYLCSDQTDIPPAEVTAKLRTHLASGHRTTSEDQR